ncbi:MAG: deoxyguanosinetriphosphate triphosphohydrolase [Desulfovibrionaceae bacterium]
MAMHWKTLLAADRYPLTDQAASEPSRSAFHRDCDRIIFSTPFRRLGRKAQVHPLAHNDNIHTRLTHSLEVASVGRSLGMEAGARIALPDGVSPSLLGEIVQAACLAHDIGNPPFGHGGEEAVRHWFAEHFDPDQPRWQGLSPEESEDLKLFEGNAMGFRVVAQTELHAFAGGMRLTCATLGALLKYPWTAATAKRLNKKKYSCFASEASIMNGVAERLGLIRRDKNHWSRHPLAFLMEAADDICYRLLDMEDAVALGILPFARVRDTLAPLCGGSGSYAAVMASAMPDTGKLGYLRSKAIGALITEVADVFAKLEGDIMTGAFEDGLLAQCSPAAREVMGEAKRVFNEEILRNRRKVELEIGAHAALGAMLDAFTGAVHEYVSAPQGGVSYKTSLIMDLLGPFAPQAGEEPYEAFQRGEGPYQAYMRVMDFIGGMTDNYATRLAQQIGGMAHAGTMR